MIKYFAKKYCAHFVELQGLGPQKYQTNQDQLDFFIKKLSEQISIPKVKVNDWVDAFTLLFQYTETMDVLILLDEISWMGAYDPDFTGKLKAAWDGQFSQNSKLRLVLCGSVSSWIQANILHNTIFLGRVSLEINLRPLSLFDAHKFWGPRQNRISNHEKFKILSVVGGIPLYLEEIDYTKPAEANIRELFFKRDGLLFKEFDRIFNDIFNKKAKTYQKIVEGLVSGGKNISEIAKALKISPTGTLTESLNNLELSGFVSRHVGWDLINKKAKTKTIIYRISDNYLRFYLKYVLPLQDKIEKNIYSFKGLEQLPQFETVMGLQFEALVIGNIWGLVNILNIARDAIENYGPYFQKKTLRTQACQIDLLIQTKTTLFVCEIKFRKNIGLEVINEVQEKIERLKKGKFLSVRPILIYEGELDPRILEEHYFDKIVSFADFLTIKEDIS